MWLANQRANAQRNPNWKQDLPAMQYVALLMSVEGDASNIRDGHTLDVKQAANRICKAVEQLRDLLPFVEMGVWEYVDEPTEGPYLCGNGQVGCGGKNSFYCCTECWTE